jgi:oligosaccharide repeat unit polymerase
VTLILTGIVADSLNLDPEHAVGGFSVCVSLIALWTFWSWYRLHGTIFDPYALVLTSSWLFNGGAVMLEVLHLNENGILGSKFSSDTILKTEYLVVLAICSLHFGALVINPANGVVRRQRVASVRDLSWHTRWTGWVMLLVSIGPAIWVFKDAVAIVMAGGYLSLYQRSFETGFATTPRVIANFLGPSALFLLAGSKGKRTALFTSAIVMLAYAGGNFFLGSRSAASTALIAYAWLYSRSIRRIRAKYLIVPALVLTFIAFPLIRAIRDTRGSDRMSIEATRGAWSGIDNPVVSAISEMGHSMCTVSYTLELFPSHRPYDNGASYLYALLAAMPNVAWSVHPTTAHGYLSTWLVRTVEPATAAMGGGLGYSYIAEAYANFGWIGVPALLFLFGLAAGKLSFLAMRRSDSAMLALTAAVLAVAIMYARAETADFVRDTSWYAIAPFLLIRLVSGVRR